MNMMKKMICLVISLFVLSFSFLPQAFATENEFEEAPVLLTVNQKVPLDVKAKAYVLMDLNTGTLLAAENENERLYPASVTKVMTLLLVCEAIRDGKLSLDTVISCSSTASAKGGSQIWLEPGEEMTVNDLLKAAFIYSANDACCLLGETLAGSEEAFVVLMNEKAAKLGMTNTHFDNCTGLDDDTSTHLTTAYDVALMSRELMKIDFVKEYTTIWMDSLRDGKTQLVNTNRLVRFYRGATGLKTGTTSKAGCCVSATAERDGLGLVAVVLGAGNSNDRFNGARTLLDYGFAHYEIFSPVVGKEDLREVRIHHGEKDEIFPELPVTSPILIDKGAAGRIEKKVVLEETVEAPVEAGSRLGKVSFMIDGAEIASYPLSCAEDVPRLGLFAALQRIVSSVFVQSKNN